MLRKSETANKTIKERRELTIFRDHGDTKTVLFSVADDSTAFGSADTAATPSTAGAAKLCCCTIPDAMTLTSSAGKQLGPVSVGTILRKKIFSDADDDVCCCWLVAESPVEDARSTIQLVLPVGMTLTP